MRFSTPGRLATYAAELESHGNPFCQTLLERPFLLPIPSLINKPTVLTECTLKPPPLLPTPPPSEPSEPTVIERLIAANSDVWEKLMNNQFCKLGYTSSATKFDNIYRAFAKQDYLYLLEYARLFTFRALRDPATHTLAGLRKMVVEDLPRKVNDAEEFLEACVGSMGISEEEMVRESMGPQIAGYTSWLQLHAMTDDVFAGYVRMVPCLYGWNAIAHRLSLSYTATENTLFHTHWFRDSILDRSANKLSDYLEANRVDYECPANWKKWNESFRQACLFEIAFFEAAMGGRM
ncbi:hypothetical protein K440DRAFT_665347, partial [Wilcoxina mikolae CBS 423.85]